MSATLDTFTALRCTSAADLTEARTIDLRSLSLQDAELLSACPALRILHLGSNRLPRIPASVLQCGRLVKLDLSSNTIVALPNPQRLQALGSLRVLYLHDNQLSSLKACRALTELPVLARLTLHDNPLASHVSYRHFLVNTIATLKCLDEHLVSDEELIEGAKFGEGRFSTLSTAAFFAVFEPPPRAAEGATADCEATLSQSYLGELSRLSTAHKHFSPVLRMQAGARARIGRVASFNLKEKGESAKMRRDSEIGRVAVRISSSRHISRG